MYWKALIMTIAMSLVMAGAAIAQQQDNQTDGFLGIGGGQQEQGQQTFTGTVDKAGEEHVLIVGDKAYQLDADDEEMVEGLMGQEVEVLGTLEDETIQVDSINRAGESPMGGTGQGTTEQPMGGYGTGQNATEQPMGGTGTGQGTTEQPMGGNQTQQGNQTGW
jgi:hypothetical protein